MVQAVHRAVRLLRELATAHSHLGVTQLAERLGMAKPTVHAMLRTLESDGLVTQDRETSRYQLGPGLLELGNAYLDTHQLRARSATWANLLAAQTGSTVWVGVLTGSRVTVVHHAFRPNSIVQPLETGASVPWNTSALGKAIVAFLTAEQRARMLSDNLERLTASSLVDADRLALQLDRIRETGYAIEEQETTLGDAGIAAPTFDQSGEVAGAIGLVGPVERLLAPDEQRDLALTVRETARTLSRDLGAPRSAGLSAEG